MSKKNVLITGGMGQLGKSFQAVKTDFADLQLHPLSHSRVDITDRENIRNAINRTEADYVINAAAYTAVDEAEENEKLAFSVNCNGAYNISTVCAEAGIPLIHISTDYVYHNDLNRPLKETDPKNPKGVYARSKREGEKAIEGQQCDYIILRASWIYSEYKSNFVKTMFSFLKNHDKIQVVNDQIGAPCWADELASDILCIISGDMQSETLIKNNTGIYNYTQLGTASWYDIVVKMQAILGSSTVIEAVGTEAFPRPADRPAYSLMDVSKIRSTFDVSLRHWSHALRDCLVRMQEE